MAAKGRSVGVDSGANCLQRKAHGFACDGGEAFEAEDVVGTDHVGDLFCEGGWIGDFGAFYHEGFKFIMAVFMFVVVVVVIIVVVVMVVMVVDLVTGIEVVFGTDALAEEDVNGQCTHGGFDHLHAIAGFGFEFGDEGCALVRVEQIGFVHNDHVGAGDLVFEQFGQRCFMVEVFIHGALGVDCGHIVGEAAFCDGFAIDDSDNAIYGDAGADFGPVEGAHERLGQG